MLIVGVVVCVVALLAVLAGMMFLLMMGLNGFSESAGGMILLMALLGNLVIVALCGVGVVKASRWLQGSLGEVGGALLAALGMSVVGSVAMGICCVMVLMLGGIMGMR